MKIINDFTRKVAVLLFASVALLVSCNDEEKIGGDDAPVVIADSLANAFAEQVAAMRLMSGQTPADVSYAVLREAGDVLVALGDETSFVSYPEDVEFYPVLAQSVENGVACWALLDKEGNAELLKDADGAAISTSEDVALKLTKQGYAVVAGDNEFDTVFEKEDKIQAFACDFHMDTESKIYAVTFVFAGGFSKSYPSKNYNSVGFLLPYDLESDYLSEFFVNYSSTSALVLEIPAGVAYTLEVTEGWTVDADVDAVTYVTAPAEMEGESTLKVVSQECGVVLAELSLVNEPFRSMLSSTTDVFIDPSVGLRKFVYGLSEFSEYDQDAVLALSEGILAGSSEPQAGCAVAEESVKVSIAELLGAEIDPDKRYVLWAVPALYREGENAGYYVEDGLVCIYEFGAMAFDLELVEAKTLDAEIAVSANGVEAVYGGVVAQSEDAMELIASKLRNGYFTSLPATDGEFSFNGLMSAYPGGSEVKNEIFPSTAYLVWVAPAFPGDYMYEVDDLTYIEVTTNACEGGGSVEVTMGEAIMNRDQMSVPLDAPGASMIYYAAVNNTDGKIYSGEAIADSDKFDLIMRNSPKLECGSSVAAVADKLTPGTTYWIYATAVDAEGKYGPVKCVSGKTQTMVYDTSITLTVTPGTLTSSKIEYTVTSNGGDLSDYIYWFGTSMEAFWANCGKDYRKAQEYMALNPDDENIKKAMNKYGELSSDGKIVMEDLRMDTEYVFIILEKGEELYSKAARSVLKTLSANLGVVVKEGSEQWNAAKASITLDWIEEEFAAAENSSMMAFYAFNFSCQTDLTAFVLCGSENYFSSAGITKMEHIMIEIENYVGRCYADGKTPIVDDQLAEEPDYYKNGVLKKGQLMNVYNFYVHGNPENGFATYFAEGSHGEGNCIYWGKGICEKYKEYEESIAYYNTLAPWLAKAKQFELTGAEADAWAQDLLEAYSVYYKDAKPIVYENTGAPLKITSPYATGKNEDGVIPDRVIVMFKDLQGNYYEPMYFEVPDYFTKEL